MMMMVMVVVVVFVFVCVFFWSLCVTENIFLWHPWIQAAVEYRHCETPPTTLCHSGRVGLFGAESSHVMSGWALELEGCRKQIWEFSKQHQIEYDTSRNNLGNWSQSVSSGLVTAVCTSFEYFRMSCFGVKANTTEASGGSAFCKAADGWRTASGMCCPWWISRASRILTLERFDCGKSSL